MRKTYFVFFSFSILLNTVLGQNRQDVQYLWPTGASKYLTSSFGEYRARRFHTGIDIKTWGKTGYKVYAIRDGYVLRVSVSPNGYGKVIYLKLDTGETAVFAHLSKFSERIQKLVDAEQRRLGRYRVNLYLKPGRITVSQGDVIAYTGQTGIGAPHLHFEIRDKENRPLNPLSKGYQIPDQVKPIVRRLSFTPLDIDSEVNGDFVPLIITPKWVGNGQYVVSDTISVWGNVGLGVRAFDKGVSSLGGYGVYALRLYVDDIQRFEYSYDRIAFRDNLMVETERDYRLARRGLGRFYKLYKDQFNSRSNYRPNRTWAGVIRSATLKAEPTLKGTAAKIDYQTGSLFPGLHEFRIEIADYLGNISEVRGHLQVGAPFDIHPIITRNEDGQFILSEVVTYDLKEITEVNAFALNGKKWQAIPIERSQQPDEKGGEGAVEKTEDALNLLLQTKHSANPLILKINAKDQFNTTSNPYFYFHPDINQQSKAPEITLNFDYYDNYLRLELISQNILKGIPEVVLYPDRATPIPIRMRQKALKKYIGRMDLSQLRGAFHLMKITVKGPDGISNAIFKQFEARPVQPGRSDQIASTDGRFWVNFWSGSLFQPIFTRINIDSIANSRNYDFVSPIYEVGPQDALLKQGAFVHIKYPTSEKMPQQIGVYYKDVRSGKWIFIDSNIDYSIGSISAKVLSFEQFALIRDSVAPEITRIRPVNNTRLRDATPRISFNVHDLLSGIKSEQDITVMLNGRPLIAEYDPERRRVFYNVTQPLAKGRHELFIRAQDNAKNVAVKTSVFWID